MKNHEPIIRNVSDTALWVANYRAQESERPDAVFIDPYARRLAGTRGQDIANNQAVMSNMLWPFTARTWLIDQLIYKSLKEGFDQIINLAAGLDTRPYRMDLPSQLQWTEIDLPGIMNYKEGILKDAKPKCQLERVRFDLSSQETRKDLLTKVVQSYKKTLVISEGLLIYLDYPEVDSLASDLHQIPTCENWVIDLSSPGLMRMMKEKMDDSLDKANASFKFAPEEGSEYFRSFGWYTAQELSIFKTARKLRRLPFFMSLLALLPERKKDRIKRPWSGVILLSRTPPND